LGIEPIIISSTAASQWGANDPNFTWLDMEAVLRKHQVFAYKSVAASLGGVGDDAIGLTKRGRRMLERAIERNEIPFLADIEPDTKRAQIVDEEGEKPAPNLALFDEDRVRERMRVYYERAGDRTIKAYINVGGGTVSVGTKVGKRKFSPGVNARPPKGARDWRRVSETPAESVACWHRVGADPPVALRRRTGPMGHSNAPHDDSPGEYLAASTANAQRVYPSRRQE
ncbi:MAG: poly-gamma-glutamate system protein, partial [Deltaproteobacteria bacterium]|nr:poly-gamma-glutamate system protein [Deltaproteobacteria bacterium]